MGVPTRHASVTVGASWQQRPGRLGKCTVISCALRFPFFFPRLMCSIQVTRRNRRSRVKKKKKREKRNKGKETRKEKRNKKRSTGPSRVVPHRSTTPARTCLTSLFGWEAVSQADMAALKKFRKNGSLISTSRRCHFRNTTGHPLLLEARAISPQPAGKVFNKSRSHQRERSDVHAMLSTLVAIAAFAPPAARTSPHAARSVDQPLRTAQPLCKVWDPDDKVIYVGVPSR